MHPIGMILILDTEDKHGPVATVGMMSFPLPNMRECPPILLQFNLQTYRVLKFDVACNCLSSTARFIHVDFTQSFVYIEPTRILF